MSDGYLNKPLFKKIFVDHICTDIQWNVQSDRYLAAAQLLLNAVDIISGLTRPAHQEDTTRKEFIAWADKFMSLKGNKYQLTGTDIYAARCGFSHGYTPHPKLVREGKAKTLSYVDASTMPVMTDDGSLIIVSLKHLKEAFTEGLIATMKEINSSVELSTLVNPRLDAMFYTENLPEKFQNL